MLQSGTTSQLKKEDTLLMLKLFLMINNQFITEVIYLIMHTIRNSSVTTSQPEDATLGSGKL